MKYSNGEIESIQWNKNSSKQILKYAVGSLLYCPASRPDISNIIVNKTIKHLKSLSICLEDSIMDDNIEYAEKILLENISNIYNSIDKNKISIDELPLIFIRIRSDNQFKKLLKQLNNYLDILTGFIIPKFDSSNFNQYIEIINSITNKNIYIMPIIESQSVLDIQTRQNELLKIKQAISPIDSILNIRVGGNDFCNRFGLRRDVKHSIYDINVIASVLSDIMNTFGRDYVVSAPVWEYFENGTSNKDWIYGLKSELALDRLNGFTGKTCIHPSQLPIIQEAMMVDANDYEDAKNILGWHDNILGVQKGTNGRMNEVKVHSKWAEKIITMAKIYGVKSCEEEN